MLNGLVETGNSKFENQLYSSALKNYYEALDGYKIIFDKGHPSIAMTLNNIALTYKK